MSSRHLANIDTPGGKMVVGRVADYGHHTLMSAVTGRIELRRRNKAHTPRWEEYWPL